MSYLVWLLVLMTSEPFLLLSLLSHINTTCRTGGFSLLLPRSGAPGEMGRSSSKRGSSLGKMGDYELRLSGRTTSQASGRRRQPSGWG